MYYQGYNMHVCKLNIKLLRFEKNFNALKNAEKLFHYSYCNYLSDYISKYIESLFKKK